MRSLVWVLVLTLGCGGRSWPVVTGTADRAFVTGQLPVRTVDVLPLDVAVTRHPDVTHDEARVASGLRRAAEATIYDALGRRGYAVAARMVLPWMTETDLVSTLDSLSLYGAAQAEHGTAELLVPYLPVALGQGGADATLYVGGWAYLGKDPPEGGRGKKILKWTIIGAVVVVGVVVIAIFARKGGGGGAGGAALRAVASSAKAVANVAARTSFRIARGVGYVTRATVDGLGRGFTHIDVCTSNQPTGCTMQPNGWATHPYQSASVGYEQEHARRTPPSIIEMEMTLVDNRTGRTLWHTRQRFSATAARAGEVREVMKRMVGALPRAQAAH